MKRQILISLIILSFLPAFATAAVFYVPDNYATIQMAIDAQATDGNEIVVRDGTWTGAGNFDLDFSDVNEGFGIILRSENGPAKCIIDCQNNGRGMFFFNNEDETTVIKGFTIRNGNATFETHVNNDDVGVLFYEDGGGIYCRDGASPQIISCVIENNYAFWYGGGIACLEGSNPEIINCLIKDNFADDMGGAIFCDASNPVINACTITRNRAGIWYFNSDQGQDEPRSGIACLNGGSPDITNSVIWEQYQWDTVALAWYGGDDLYECTATYSCIEDGIGGEATNIADDPEFRTGVFGDYYLAQLQAGNLLDSPCIDSGTGGIRDLDEYNIGRVTTSTSTVYQADRGIIDMGYHYPEYTSSTAQPPFPPDFQLTVTVVGGGGTVDPTGVNLYPFDTNVPLMATPTPGYKVEQWTGTNDDTSTANDNSVLMDANKTVTVEFEFDASRILYVPGDYSTIQAAIDDARDGDIIELAATGSDQPYISSWGFDVADKAITITSTNPDDPDCVADTVIEKQVGPEGHGDSAFNFVNVGRNTILNGITLRQWSGVALDGLDADDFDEEDDVWDGVPGGRYYGGAISCRNASPTIKNCIIIDCNITGGNGGLGADGDDDHPNGGNGGWPGGAYGGGMSCLFGSSPAVINCTFNNNTVIGGNGGDGGSGNDDPWGYGGRGGGYYYGYPVPSPWEWFGYWWYDDYDDPSKYSGRGGAVYVGPDCSPEFTDCTFTNNQAVGGLNGICGPDGDPPALIDEPSINWKIDNLGGAVFCDDFSKVEFVGCTFSGNVADTNTDPTNDDPYASYGGAVAFTDNANVSFEDCTFNDNLACIGGGLYTRWGNPQIEDCNFTGNSAYHGGGVLFVGGTAEISRSLFTQNIADGSVGEGGAICSLGTNTEIVDCDISDNDANGSGGGIYISNKNIYGEEVSGENTVLIKNCLITNNLANRDGGGISANWYSEPNIINCTIADNTVTGTGFETGYGGGLSCSYENYTNVINSIIWGNSSQYGPQLAIGTGFGYDPRPSTVDVSYSDFQGGQSYVFIDENCTLNWGVGNIHIDPLFVTGPLGDYYLSQIAAGQPVDSNCVDAGSDLPSLNGGTTGGTGGTTVTVSTAEYLETYAETPDVKYIIQVSGTIDITGLTKLGITSNKTIKGVGVNPTIIGNIRFVSGSSNIIIEGLNITNPSGHDQGDGITVKDNITNLFITQCTIYDCADGCIDITNGSDFVTVSWCKFYYNTVTSHRFVNLIGSNDTRFTDRGKLRVTMHHNWWSTMCDQRMPRVRFGQVHVYNNYYSDLLGGGYCHGVGVESQIRLENNYYDAVSNPWENYSTAGIQGIIGWNGGNVFSGCSVPTWAPNDYATIFTPPYSYTLDTGTDVKSIVMAGAGNIGAPSPCAADGWASYVSDVGLYQYTTRTDEKPDRKTVDMGYHYLVTPEAEPCRFCELFRDGIINFKDFAVFALNWLSEDCNPANEWCQHSDVTFDTYVNFEDLGLFAECWLVEDTYPPVPNPSEWEIEPYSSWSPANPNSVSMTARTADEAWDFWAGQVQYYFDCVSGGGSDSGWQNDPNYIDSNLVIGIEYGYRVRARDASERIPDDGTGEPGNKTDWSPIRYAIAGEEPPLPEDHNPPTPNPMTWATEPYATSPTSIAMVATTATDDTADVEYYFEDFDYPVVNSGWIDVPTWTDVGLTPNTMYTYRVKARDTSAWYNETGWSDPCSATTPEEEEPPPPPPPPDTTAPTPNPSQWAAGGEPTQYYNSSNGYYYHTMTAEPAADAENEPVEYYFEFVGGGYGPTSSGWQLSNVYDYPVSVNPAQYGVYKVRTRDSASPPNMSGWSEELSTGP